MAKLVVKHEERLAAAALDKYKFGARDTHLILVPLP
jgi:hypothetical protein